MIKDFGYIFLNMNGHKTAYRAFLIRTAKKAALSLHDFKKRPY